MATYADRKSRTKRQAVCKWCLESFSVGQGSLGIYCSAKCQGLGCKKNTCDLVITDCRHCGVRISVRPTNKVYCSAKCSSEGRKPQHRPSTAETALCIFCSSEFKVWNPAQKACQSAACKKLWSQQLRQRPQSLAAKRSYMSRRRARLVACTVEVFLDSEVFERDNWVCHICDEPVDGSLPCTDPMSVSLRNA